MARDERGELKLDMYVLDDSDQEQQVRIIPWDS